MSRIRSKNTSPEIALRKALWKLGYKHRIHYKLPGSPDIVYVSRKLAVFVDGCFWHNCPIHGHKVKSNKAFWKRKIKRNVERDKKQNRELRRMGWKVVRLWEHDVRKNILKSTKKVLKHLEN